MTEPAPERRSSFSAWLPAAAALVGSAWGSNQFTPMLLVYHRALGLSTGTLEAMFGFYAIGLIPGLFVAGAVSDTRGRRPVVLASAALSLAGSIALALAGHAVLLLFVGRMLAGLSSGAAFSAGTVWLRELSRPPFGTASDQATARRAAIAMSFGFGIGPLVSGLLAQWAPLSRVVPYLPHIAFMILVLAALPRTAETSAGETKAPLRASLSLVRAPRFSRVAAPMAPWVFAAPAIAFALLPSVVGAQHATDGVALTAAITTLCALTGVAAQPLARRLDTGGHANRLAIVGLLVLVAGLVVAAVAAHVRENWLLVPAAVVLGGAYGLTLVAGLVEVQRLASERAQAGLTAIFYALTYLGFAAPYLLALGAHYTSYTLLLSITAALALATAVRVASRPGLGAQLRQQIL